MGAAEEDDGHAAESQPSPMDQHHLQYGLDGEDKPGSAGDDPVAMEVSPAASLAKDVKDTLPRPSPFEAVVRLHVPCHYT